MEHMYVRKLHSLRSRQAFRKARISEDQEALVEIEQELADLVGISWMPACGGTETPFKSRSGDVLLYMWNEVSGEHAYYNVSTDLFLTNDEASGLM